MKIAFHSNQLGERGTEICLYKYAKYNQEILGNESIIVSNSSKPTPSIGRFKDFKVILYDEPIILGSRNEKITKKLEKICVDENVDSFYAIKSGNDDGCIPYNVKTLCHCVFTMDQPHGSVYAGVCKYISDKYGSIHPYVHHIIEKEQPNVTDNFRKKFGIPNDALVLGRHGGNETFNLPFVYPAIEKALEDRKDLWFVFLNTQKFSNHERIIHIPWTMDEVEKAKFVNTCDVMIHGRRDGEIFSLSTAEFLVRNKPVITWLPDQIPDFYDIGHIVLLKEKGIYYKDTNSLYFILKNLDKEKIKNLNWDIYGETYSPKNVMNEFKEVFLK